MRTMTETGKRWPHKWVLAEYLTCGEGVRTFRSALTGEWISTTALHVLEDEKRVCAELDPEDAA